MWEFNGLEKNSERRGETATEKRKTKSVQLDKHRGM